ncbi:MAG: hypothetical protein N3A63_05350 [Bacteroidetes bacterium]|nr:hypothetical protein [Bacteroidota bacterium]
MNAIVNNSTWHNEMENLVSVLEDMCSLTTDLQRAVLNLDEAVLEYGLKKRRELLERVEQYQQVMQQVTMSDEERSVYRKRIIPLLQSLMQADHAFMTTLEEKKKEIGTILSTLYRQRDRGQYNHGGYYGNQ